MSDNVKRFASVNLRNAPNLVKRGKSLKIPIGNRQSRHNSVSGLEELIQCGICLEELVKPRMLDCQHTFCLSCLQTLFLDETLVLNRTSSGKIEVNTCDKITSLTCPTCSKVTQLENGINSLENLRGNLYIDSLLKLVKGHNSPPTTTEYRCVKCQTVSNNNSHQMCQHCSQIFCNICWNDHMTELNAILQNLSKQLDDTDKKLEHKTINFNNHCQQIKETIKSSIEEKVSYLLKQEKQLSRELESFKSNTKVSAENLNTRVKVLKKKISEEAHSNGNNKANAFMNLHKETSALLNEICNFGESKVIYDSDKCRLDICDEGIYNDPDDVDLSGSPLDPIVNHYKTRSFTPKLKWSKCPRPAGIGIAPWDTSKLYIATADSRGVLIMNREKNKLVRKITHDEMICPCAVAFSIQRNEIFVSDKWKHCVHVFSKDEEYLRMICHKEVKTPNGIGIGANNEIVISDTGNNRIIIANSTDGKKISEITGLNNPTGLVLYGDNIIVADTGNHRIKTFNFQGELLQEFGSLGKNPGQFRYAEVVAVDNLGFILVGDAGNARIQVFSPTGTIIRIFGSKEGFGWISGLTVTPELDIITTDHKNKTLMIF